MARLSLNTRESVFAAAEECDSLGREQFLRKYGFGKSREYYLFLNGKHYDSKAICGVAYGVEHPTKGPLSAEDFSGGEATVQRVLEALGFTVVRGRPERTEDLSALVLVENEVTMGGEYDFWEDDTGVQYQYPNQYKTVFSLDVPLCITGGLEGVAVSADKQSTSERVQSGRYGETQRFPEVSHAAVGAGFAQSKITSSLSSRFQQNPAVGPMRKSSPPWDGVQPSGRFRGTPLRRSLTQAGRPHPDCYLVFRGR